MERGHAICKHCGAYLRIDKLDDFYEWNDSNSMGWAYTCPKCDEENYKEINFENYDTNGRNEEEC